MRIESANVSMNASHRYEQQRRTEFQRSSKMMTALNFGFGGTTGEQGLSAQTDASKEKKLTEDVAKEQTLSGIIAYAPVETILQQMENAIGTADSALEAETETLGDFQDLGIDRFAKILGFDVEATSETTESVYFVRRASSYAEDYEVNPIYELRQLVIRQILERIFRQRSRYGGGDTTEARINALFEDAGYGTSYIGSDGLATSFYRPTAYRLEEMSFTSEYSESEETSVEMEGIVQTSDGRQIDFGINLQMSRSFRSYYEERYARLDEVPLTDPLVINFDGELPELSDMTFLFDIDADGEEDEIHSLSSGSGYLTLDLNGNGKVDDGSELFGTSSGDGFRDLARYDLDGNGWIDENDPVWEALKIWVKSEDGEDELYSLAEKGVGAICLQAVAADFALKGLAENDIRGMIRETGMFLFEEGRVGTVQHVDVAKVRRAEV